ncbi:hypothetical protein GLOIN_2v1840614 [Rhizophagus irregularis DAOM 181602=DAOM 197198]|nr:hypothetical protein GLOIN_2v1840614 [Rhizophagus irregularis DAOM 181602=DAOM 197198]
MTNEENVNNINNTNEDDLDFEENDSNTWTACGPMANLPTEIYCGNSLEPVVKKKIFQAEPRNKDISFTPLKMEQRMLSIMSRFDKETDKNYSRLLYKTSSVLRPIDNTLRMVYASKPTEDSGDSYESWLQLEQTVLNSRALLLDASSYGNDLRRELALKNLSSNYRKPTGQRGVFGDKLPELKQYSPVSFKSPTTGSQNSYNSYKGKNHHWIASFGKNWVTDIVQYGYRPEWLTVPPLEVHPISPNRQYKKDLKIFYDEIQALLRIGAIRELDIDTPFRILPTFQNGKLRIVEIYDPTERLYGVHRFKSSFLPCSPSSGPTTLFFFRFPEQTFLFHMFTFRFNNKSEGVHQDPSSSDKISSESRHQIDDISRRHTHNGKDERRSVTTVKGSHGYLRKNGIYNQQRKVNARTLSIDRSSAPRQKLWSETARVERYSTALRRKQVAARVVDKKSPFLEWKKFNPGRTKYYNSHRCVKYRLGCVPGQLDYPRKLDSVGVNSSHQYSGTEGDSVLHSHVQGASESNDIDSNRQHDVCSLY